MSVYISSSPALSGTACDFLTGSRHTNETVDLSCFDDKTKNEP